MAQSPDCSGSLRRISVRLAETGSNLHLGGWSTLRDWRRAAARTSIFFEHLAADTGLPLVVSYTPNDQLGVKDTYQLLMIKSGALDLVSLRFLQNAMTAACAAGSGFIGSHFRHPDCPRAGGSLFADTGSPTSETFQFKTPGTWPFSPQVFYCGKRITGSKDLAGLKVRVGSENFEPLIASQGGIPVVMPFEDVKDS